MKYKIELEEEDIIKVIADRYDVLPSDVCIVHYTVSEGYGMAEKDVQRVSAEVESDDPLNV